MQLGSMFISNCNNTLHVSDAIYIHPQEHLKSVVTASGVWHEMGWSIQSERPRSMASALSHIVCRTPHNTDNLKTKAPNTTGSNHLYNTLELLMMDIVVPETCWARNKICNKNNLLHLVGILFSHINDNARKKSRQIYRAIFFIQLRRKPYFSL
jgi:hypothetical protein